LPEEQDFSALKKKFECYPEIVTLISLVEMKQETSPAQGLRMLLDPQRIPSGLRLEPVLKFGPKTYLMFYYEQLDELARSMESIPESHFRWLNALCAALVQEVAKDKGAPEA